MISHVRLMVLPAFTKTADSPSNLALAAEKVVKRSSHSPSSHALSSRLLSGLTETSATSHHQDVVELERILIPGRGLLNVRQRCLKGPNIVISASTQPSLEKMFCHPCPRRRSTTSPSSMIIALPSFIIICRPELSSAFRPRSLEPFFEFLG